MKDVPANPYRYYPPTLGRRFNPADEQTVDTLVLQLWDRRRNTYDIALQIGVPEHDVERRLHRALEARR